MSIRRPRTIDREHERDHRPDRAGDEPREATPDQQHEERRRADVQVLEHPVALAVLEDGPGRPRDPGHERRPQRGPEHDEGHQRLVALPGAARADDLDHHDQQQQRRDRLGDGVDHEQDRVGPVGLHAPAEQERRPQAAAWCRRRPRPSARAGSNGVRVEHEAGRGRRRARSLPADRQAAADCGPSARCGGSSSARVTPNTTVIATRISASTSGGGVPVMYGWPGEHQLAHRVQPDGERDRRDRERAERAEPPDREVEARTRSTRARSRGCVMWNASRPHRRNRLASIMPRPYSADSVRANTTITRSHCSTLNVTPNIAVEIDRARRPPGSSS